MTLFLRYKTLLLYIFNNVEIYTMKTAISILGDSSRKRIFKSRHQIPQETMN